MTEIFYSIRTMWEWNDDDNRKIEEKCLEIGYENSAKIEYKKDKQSFEIKGTDYDRLDKSRDDLLKLLNSMSSSASQVLIIPRRSKKSKSKSMNVDLPPGLPPPLPFEKEKLPMMTQEDEENFEIEVLEDDEFRFSPLVKVSDFDDIFGWNRREPFLTFDYWVDICRDCKVVGDIIEEKMKVKFSKGRDRDVEEAKKRLGQLQENFLRQLLKPVRIPLVHYPNQYTKFKLYFCHLSRHPYFSRTVKIDLKDVYVLVPATLDPLTQKYLLPRDLPDSNLQRSRESNQYERTERTERTERQWQENNREEEERVAKGKAKAVPPNDNFYDSHRWAPIERPKDPEWTSNVPDSNSMDTFPALSSSRDQNRRSSNSGRPLPPENPSNQRSRRVRSSTNEGTLIDIEDESSPVIKRSIKQQNPNKNNYSEAENRPTIGKMVRDYNFSKMKDVLHEGLEYVRVHKGEIRFFGSLGKAFFTKVNEEVKERLWDFTDLKDVVVAGHKVNPRFNEIATYDSELIAGFIEVLGSNPIKSSKSAHYEIRGHARNAPTGPFTEVFMYVNMGIVSLEKVMLRWEPLVNIDWTVLDRKTDFSMILGTRRALRHDVKPFSTFVKKISVSPTTRAISFEDVKDFLLVKSVNFKQVTKFKLHFPFIAEVSRIEKLDITEQPNSNKKIGRCGPKNDVHFTIEIYNEQHREAFRKNMTLESGDIAKWTVDSILGENPNRSNLVEFVKTMLLLVERCHKVAEIKSQEAEQ